MIVNIDTITKERVQIRVGDQPKKAALTRAAQTNSYLLGGDPYAPKKKTISQKFSCLFAGTILVNALLLIGSPALGEGTVRNDFSATTFSLHLNGASYHFSRDGQNEENYGVGLSYHFKKIQSKNRILNESQVAYEVDVYHDSYTETGFATGFSWKRRMGDFLDWGLKAGLVHEEHASAETGMFVIPFVVPFVESNWTFPVNIRMMVTPPVGDITNGMLTFQLMIPLY